MKTILVILLPLFLLFSSCKKSAECYKCTYTLDYYTINDTSYSVTGCQHDEYTFVHGDRIGNEHYFEAQNITYIGYDKYRKDTVLINLICERE
jgi:hypothetical protein